ncbi:7496_t:CDS:2 [Racocetra fulgida]|uniref:7496_t:CDS:1 n=1 Tax=Racocetra fulgida TaxID=60492 RepID=A0A9N8Z7Z8_9GLOM|nr:7496_t:CDS:2 [Racocetra fulgida]
MRSFTSETINDPLPDSNEINDPLPDSNEINDPSPDPNMSVELYLFKSNESSNKKCKLSNPLHDYLVPSTSAGKNQLESVQLKDILKKFHKDIYDQLQEEIQRDKTVEPYGPNDEVKVKCITYLLIKLSCRKTISNQVDAIYQTQQLNVKKILSAMTRKMSMTTDIWTVCDGEDTMPKLVATAMAIKLDEYWQQFDKSSFIIAPLDPNIKLSLYDLSKKNEA